MLFGASIGNGYPEDAIPSCIKEQTANFQSEDSLGLKGARFSYNCFGLEMSHLELKTKSIKPLILVSML